MKKLVFLILLPLALFVAPVAQADDRVDARVVNGQPAPEGSWPSQALIRSQGYSCGGTLIHPRWVLSAAHCFAGTGASKTNTTVAIGSTSKNGAPSQPVSGIYTHSGFDIVNNNDVALLRLRSPSPFPARAIARPEDYPYFSGDQPAYIAGWGSTCFQSCSSSEELLQATVTMRSWEMCSSIYESAGLPFGPTMLCAGGGPETSDACQGDSGGPLEVDGPAGRILVGIVSWGIGCGREEYPGVYTDVSRMNSWIGSYVVSGVRAPIHRDVFRRASVSVQITSSMGLPASLRAKTKGNFAVSGSSCQGVSEGGSCQIRVRDLRRGANQGRLIIQSAAGIRLASVSLLGPR